MADVSYYERARRTPYVEKVLNGIEHTCRTYDKSITRVIWVTLAFIVWLVVAENLISTSTVEFNDTWDTSVRAQPLDSSVQSRTVFRVMRALKEQCVHEEYSTSVVLAPQVAVNGSPFMYRIVRLCASAIEFVNPVIAFQGDESGVCLDEHEGVQRRSVRQFPIAIQSEDREPYSLMRLEDVCSFMHALSLLDAQWSA